MNNSIKLLDIVALTEDIPRQGLRCGQVGTVVELLAPDIYEVEFIDDNGQVYATQALKTNQIMILHYNHTHAA